MSSNPIIVWFRQDLRLHDNPALFEAAKTSPILPIYILDDHNAGEWAIGGASRWWLHHSLSSLNKSLSDNLVLKKGDPRNIIPTIVKETNASAVYWNRCYEPWRISRDKEIKTTLECEVRSFNGSLLWEPWDKNIMKADGTPYKVFTPFFKKGCMQAPEPREPLPAPSQLNYVDYNGLKLDGLNLLPSSPEPRWDKQLEPHWSIGEEGAHTRLKEFLENGLQNYKEGRNIPSGDNVSRLSPHLHWGEISPNTAWHAAKLSGTAEGWEKDRDHFLSELGWREFSNSLLYHFPNLPRKNLQARFDQFPWQENTQYLNAWQKGQTGYPIVDAAMQELWETGYMHNRSRMIVGSFLVKHLQLHWHHGEDWFWDCLCDADLANNSASWQWIAGCGADAAPYFRIFNPITQGEKFDPDGAYVKRFLPVLQDMPKEFIHKPWEASPLILKAAGIELGKNYPKPIVDHKAAREKALAAFQTTKTN